MTKLTTEPWVTTEHVAEFLAKPESWVYNNAARVGIPRYKIGNQYRYRLSEVSAWVERAVIPSDAGDVRATL